MVTEGLRAASTRRSVRGARQHGVRLRSLLPATGVTALIEKRERPPPGSRQVTLSFSRTALSEDAAFHYEKETKHS